MKNLGAITKIGRPGPGKWKQPPGTSLFRWTISEDNMGSSSALVLIQDQFSNSRDIIRVKTTPPPGTFNSENTIVLLEHAHGRESNTSWNGTPANPRVRLLLRPEDGFAGGDIDIEDPVIESPTCDPGVRNVASVAAGLTVWQHNDVYDFGPQFFANVGFWDAPTFSVSCLEDYEMRFLILLPTAGITATPGGTGFPTSQLTLLKQT